MRARWSFASPEDWSKGSADEAEALSATLAVLPALPDRADEQAREALAVCAADVLRLRPALKLHQSLGHYRFGRRAAFYGVETSPRASVSGQREHSP